MRRFLLDISSFEFFISKFEPKYLLFLSDKTSGEILLVVDNAPASNVVQTDSS